MAVTADAPGLRAAQDSAWRGMFLSAIYPGLIFLIGSFLVSESPRWLLGRGRVAEARKALGRSRSVEEADAEFAEMQKARPATQATTKGEGTLFQRRYVIPFVLTCAVLGLTQATGINSVLQFLVVILQKAGLPAAEAAEKATYVTAVNVAFTIVGLLLVDRLGRKALLKIGTATIALSLLAAAAIFWRLESGAMTAGNGPGLAVMVALMAFIAGFATGPGVCVWLALSELMPTRIRSLGMGIGLLINQGISTAIAALFLPVVRDHGYATMFVFWAVCTVGYFAVAAWFLPETKGKTLEEIEAHFARRAA